MKEGKKLLNYLHTTFKKPDKITELWKMKELTWNNIKLQNPHNKIMEIYNHDPDVNITNISLTNGKIVIVMSNDYQLRKVGSTSNVMGKPLTPFQLDSMFSDKNVQMIVRVDHDIT